MLEWSEREEAQEKANILWSACYMTLIRFGICALVRVILLANIASSSLHGEFTGYWDSWWLICSVTAIFMKISRWVLRTAPHLTPSVALQDLWSSCQEPHNHNECHHTTPAVFFGGSGTNWCYLKIIRSSNGVFWVTLALKGSPAESFNTLEIFEGLQVLQSAVKKSRNPGGLVINYLFSICTCPSLLSARKTGTNSASSLVPSGFFCFDVN